MSRDPFLDELHAVTSRQHGCVRTDQLRDLGATRNDIARLTRSARLVRLTPRVFSVPGAPVTEQQQAFVAVADAGPGAVLSLHSGAALWGAPGYSLAPFHVLCRRPGLRRQHKPHLLHLSRHLLDHHVTEFDGIQVVTPTRLPFDLARHLHPERLARLVDHLWSRRLTTASMLRQAFGEIAGQGWDGTKVMREILDERGPDYRPPESGLEGRVAQILRDAGLQFERQVDLGDDAGWLARVDFRHVTLPVVLEVDGDRFHRALVDRRHDAERQRALEATGFVVVRVCAYDVWHRPASVVAAARAAVQTVRRPAA